MDHADFYHVVVNEMKRSGDTEGVELTFRFSDGELQQITGNPERNYAQLKEAINKHSKRMMFSY